MTTITLPPPQPKGAVSVEEALSRRRSVRRYSPETLSLFQLSQVLWAAQGLTRGRFRTAPSAGATYPLEVFVVTGERGVEGLQAGIYHYEVEKHCLTLRQVGDKRGELSEAALGQGFIRQAPLNIVICAIYGRTCDYYGRRGERYVHMEVGHVGQNIHLQAEALGLGTVVVGAFSDERVSQVIGVEAEIKPLYIMPLGKWR